MYRHMQIKKPKINFIIEIFLIENECKTPYRCVISFSIKTIFYDKMELRLFCFCMMIYSMCQLIKILQTSSLTP